MNSRHALNREFSFIWMVRPGNQRIFILNLDRKEDGCHAFEKAERVSGQP
jgi:hypothetical protein